jgi:hypothetical protein
MLYALENGYEFMERIGYADPPIIDVPAGSEGISTHAERLDYAMAMLNSC